MNLKKQLMVSVCLLTAVGVAGQAFAQDKNEEAVKTRAITVEDEAATEVYSTGKGINSGVNVFNETAVKALSSGSGDVNAMLRVLPQLEFDKDRFSTDKKDLIDLRPLDISISGGRAFENNISIDGINIVSHLDVSEQAPANYDKLASGKSQFQWVDSGLVGDVELQDSNVSAQYGNFTGGVLNVTTRAPLGKLGVEAYSKCTGDDLTSFKVNKKSKERYDPSQFADEPDYSNCNLGINLDLPEIYGFKFLISQSYAHATYTDYRDTKYGGSEFKDTSTSKTTMVKVQKNLGTFALLDAQFTYAPYESEYSGTNAFTNTITTKGSGNRASIKLKGLESKFFGSDSWDLTFNYNHNDGGRDAPQNNLVWPSDPRMYTCGNDTCTSGGFGRLASEEDNYRILSNASWTLPIGKIRAGMNYEHTDALRQRYDENHAYRAIGTTLRKLLGEDRPTTVSDKVVCENTDPAACIDGFAALEYRITYTPYKAEVGLDTASLYAEWEAEFGKLTTRVGGRVDYNSFLKNTDISPRLTASYDFGAVNWYVGANRYYSASFLGYALNEQATGTLIDYRLPTKKDGKLVYSDNWIAYSETRPALFNGVDLKTPYSDEFTTGLNLRLPYDISSQLRYVYREGHDLFSYGDGQTVTYTKNTGEKATYKTYAPNNDGKSRYHGVSAEFTKNFSKNLSMIANIAWSETRRDTEDYMDSFDDQDAQTDMIYYNGEVISMYQLRRIAQAENFATPLKINVALVGKFFNDDLSLGVSSRWSDSFDTIDSLGTYTTIKNDKGSIRYQNYGKVTYKASTEFDLNAKYRLINSGGVNVYLEGNVSNVFDIVQNDVALSYTNPYNKGRVIWLGMRVKY